MTTTTTTTTTTTSTSKLSPNKNGKTSFLLRRTSVAATAAVEEEAVALAAAATVVDDGITKINDGDDVRFLVVEENSNKVCEDQESCKECFHVSLDCSWTIVSDKSGNSVGRCSNDPCTDTPNNDGRRSLSLILCGHGVSVEEKDKVKKKIWKKENTLTCKKLTDSVPTRPPNTCSDRSGDCVHCLKSTTTNKKNNDEECVWVPETNTCEIDCFQVADVTCVTGSLPKKEAKKECKVLHDGGDSDEGGDGNSDSDSEDEDKDEDEATVGGKNDDGPIRHLEGYRNRMPTIGMDGSGSGGGGGGRDYIILGSHDEWKSSQPSLLTIIDDSEGTETTTTTATTTRSREVEKETYDYMSRGWSLEKDGTYNGLVKLENGENITVIVTVSTVY
mmetsp:Transcript_6960/g.8051  ORF Transcript_6960/g.8051 Transcript_6960/m.8051 type:complete len:389 (-) Transcript_6960:260-1426(-)